MNEKNRGVLPASRLSPSELTQKIAQANVFDLNSLEANRSGWLSRKQLLVSVAAVGSFLFSVAGFFALNYFVVVGFVSLFSHSPLKVVISLGVSVAIIAIFWWKGKKGGAIGLDRYAIKDLGQIPLKCLLVVDLLRGRVSEYRGPVSHHTSTGIVRTNERRDWDNPGWVNPFAEEHTIHYYAYKAGREVFPVSVEAYEALQGKPQDCRLYYLPLSKIMVNMEVLQV